MGISGGHTAQTSWLAVQETAISCEWRETKQVAPSRAPRSGFKVSWMVPWLTHSLPTAGMLLFTSGQPHFPTNIRAHAESQEAFLSPVTDIHTHTGCKGKAIANPGGRRQGRSRARTQG